MITLYVGCIMLRREGPFDLHPLHCTCPSLASRKEVDMAKGKSCKSSKVVKAASTLARSSSSKQAKSKAGKTLANHKASSH